LLLEFIINTSLIPFVILTLINLEEPKNEGVIYE